MQTFWRLMERSTITSGIVAMALVGTACYCAVTQIPMPEILVMALGTVIGFFFSSKVKDDQARAYAAQ